MNVAIIVAAGQGLRMGTKRAKQFLELDGIPVIIHTLTRFEQCRDINRVVVVLPKAELKTFPALARKYGLRKAKTFVEGGKTRAQSVRLGMKSLQRLPPKLVAIHDGVRPFVTPEEISATIRVAARTGAAILVAPVTDTIKIIYGDRVVPSPPRAELRRALTPQCFKYRYLWEAFEDTKWSKSARSFTDESKLMENRLPSTVVEGNPRNVKITYPEDIALAEIILKQNPEFKIEAMK